MAYRMALVLVTLNDLEDHLPVAGLFKCNPWFVQHFTSRNASATAGFLLYLLFAVVLAHNDGFHQLLNACKYCVSYRIISYGGQVRMVVISDAWCGIVNSCPVMEGDDVTVGCYGQYDWLGYLLQYSPVVWIDSSIQFLEDANTYRTITPFLQSAPGPPEPEALTTAYTMHNVQAGQTINATCQIDFNFYSYGYSPRNTYAYNDLQWRCSIRQRVNCEYFRSIKLYTKLLGSVR